MNVPAQVIRPSMEAPDGKLRWAIAHGETLKDQIRIFETNHPYRVSSKIDPDTGEYVFNVHGIGPTNPNWGLMFGDVVHNLRSALDHLVYQLAILGQGGRALTDDEARSSSFPIYDDPGSIPNPTKSGPIKLLRVGEQTRLLELQPFNANDPSIWGSSPRLPYGRLGPSVVPEWLQRLSAFDNIDKHRTINPSWQYAAWHEAPHLPSGFRESPDFHGSLDTLEDKAEVGRWERIDPDAQPPSDVDMKRYFPLNVAFGEAPALNNAATVIDIMANVVALILELFRPCVETGDTALPVKLLLGPLWPPLAHPLWGGFTPKPSP